MTHPQPSTLAQIRDARASELLEATGGLSGRNPYADLDFKAGFDAASSIWREKLEQAVAWIVALESGLGNGELDESNDLKDLKQFLAQAEGE